MGKSSSPLRYPGGKSKLYPYVSEFIDFYYKEKPVYAEAFAGGFGLGIELLFNNKVSKVLINDYDPCIYAFWKSITSEKYHDKFVKKILDTDFSIDTWRKEKDIYLHPNQNKVLDLGYATFHLNRCNRSGILMANPIGGIGQNGKYKMNCRYNKVKLIELINRIFSRRDNIVVTKYEANDFVKKTDRKYNNLLFNFDPPYVNAGPMLYKNFYKAADHYNFSKTVHGLKNRWIMTYDDNELIRTCYAKDIVRTYSLPYSLEEKCKAEELIIYDIRFTNPKILDLSKH